MTATIHMTTNRLRFLEFSPHQVPATHTAPETIPARGSGTVLLVEDEQSVLRLVSRILRGAGYEVLEAGDGEEALRISHQHVEPIAGLVTDVDMPGMDGVELARRLAQQRPELPVLFISGLAQEGLDGEHSRFVSKPFSEGAILENLRELIEAG